MKNKIGMNGIDFIEFAAPSDFDLDKLFKCFGMQKAAENRALNRSYYQQNDIHFFISETPQSHAQEFSKKHGPSISAMAWRFKNPKEAFELAVQRGAKAATGDYQNQNSEPVFAVYGIGESLIYFVPETYAKSNYQELGFKKLEKFESGNNFGFTKIDHLTNNVTKGTMNYWSKFYKDIFEFEEVRYFDIRGAQTGLTSYALRSPCGQFCIPINEGSESKSQINEYLQEYNGPGIQHLAFLTEDIISSVQSLNKAQVSTLDIDNDYYREIFNKFPAVSEDHQKIKDLNILVDGDDQGYLLQIFTKNVIGPIFIEIIQRKNHYSFGEGNFGALFRSIERDQIKRGYLQA